MVSPARRGSAGGGRKAGADRARDIRCRQSARSGGIGDRDPRHRAGGDCVSIRPRVLCPGCGQGTRAQVPVDTQGQFGPHLTALIAYLTVACRLPCRVVEEMLEHLLGIEIAWEHAEVLGKKPARRSPARAPSSTSA